MKLKTLSIGLFLFATIFEVHGQVEYLRLSPAQKITQRVGATDVTIEFSRPQMNGREIFGGLVPFDKMWRTGANENTTIGFDHRVKNRRHRSISWNILLDNKTISRALGDFSLYRYRQP